MGLPCESRASADTLSRNFGADIRTLPLGRCPVDKIHLPYLLYRTSVLPGSRDLVGDFSTFITNWTVNS